MTASTTVTIAPTAPVPVWRLQHRDGGTTTCSMHRSGEAWVVMVEAGARQWIWEQHRHERSALARVAEIYDVFAELGFSETVH